MLELSHVTRRYGGVLALDDLNLEVPAGVLFGFLGPNGAGKTTAMRIIFGIATPDAGEVRWQGRPVSFEDRQRFGYLPEERGLYPNMKIAEQLEYLGTLHGMSRSSARREALTWLERFGLAGRAEDKLETLSLGNQQRVQLSAALINHPDLLVLDEPFSGLDPIGIEMMGQVLADQADAGATVIFSSHQLDLVEHYCQQVAIIDHGRLVVSGPVTELTAANPPVLVVETASPEQGWWEELATVAAGSTPTRRRLVLKPGADPQDLLRAAATAGAVNHFSFERRRLSEVFFTALADGHRERL